MELREYILKAEGYRKKVERELEFKWEIIRATTYPICIRLEALGGKKKAIPFDKWLVRDGVKNNSLERLKQKIAEHKQKYAS